MRFANVMMLILFVVFVSWGCSKPLALDTRIEVRWMEKNETVPFRGILLNDFTYLRMREKLINCEK